MSSTKSIIFPYHKTLKKCPQGWRTLNTRAQYWLKFLSVYVDTLEYRKKAIAAMGNHNFYLLHSVAYSQLRPLVIQWRIHPR